MVKETVRVIVSSQVNNTQCEYISDGETKVIEILEADDSCEWTGKPMTYFLYPGVTSEDILRHLEKNGASQACIIKAMEDLEIFYKSLYTVGKSVHIPETC